MTKPQVLWSLTKLKGKLASLFLANFHETTTDDSVLIAGGVPFARSKVSQRTKAAPSIESARLSGRARAVSTRASGMLAATVPPRHLGQSYVSLTCRCGVSAASARGGGAGTAATDGSQ